MSIISQLNKMQQEAVLTTEGPVLILAGAGSGKTKTLIHRIVYLMQEKHVYSYNILAVTFTNKAANEMKDRINLLLHEEFNESNLLRLPWMGTFHSICVKILHREWQYIGYNENFTIYDEQDAVSLIKTIQKDLGIDTKKNNPRAIKHFISSAKSELIDSKSYQKYAEGLFQETVAKVYIEYQKRLRKACAFDFDDLLNQTVRLFQKYPEILEKYQNMFRYILVDEYQDTNTPQYMLCKLLAAKHKNLCVVGDDWQSIYGFRGANFKNILNFEKDYKNVKVIKLEQNYRSTGNILNAADAIIKKNWQRSDKTLWTENKQGDLITVYEGVDQQDEINFILMEINSLTKKDSQLFLKDVVILYRTNAQSRALEEALLQFGIAYKIVGGVRFYERKEIKDMLAYLRLINNENDIVSLERIINVPRRGIGKKTLEQFVAFKNNQSEQMIGFGNKKIDQFLMTIDELRKKAVKVSPAELVDIVANVSGYKRFLLDGTPEGEARWENVEELKTVANKYETLAEFLVEVSLIADIDNYDEKADAITLMTLHNAKGLEFPIVFIVGLEEGIFPHARSLLDPNELEEERRLAYVGITRAKEKLYLTYAQSRILYGNVQANPSSRFLTEIPEHLIDKV